MDLIEVAYLTVLVDLEAETDRLLADSCDVRDLTTATKIVRRRMRARGYTVPETGTAATADQVGPVAKLPLKTP